MACSKFFQAEVVLAWSLFTPPGDFNQVFLGSYMHCRSLVCMGITMAQKHLASRSTFDFGATGLSCFG